LKVGRKFENTSLYLSKPLNRGYNLPTGKLAAAQRLKHFAFRPYHGKQNVLNSRRSLRLCGEKIG
jgi:hypothetical protein